MTFEIQCVTGTAVRRSLRIARGQSFSLHITLSNPDGSVHNGLGGAMILRVRAPGRDSSGYQVAGNATGDYYLTARGTETRWYGDAMQFEVWFIRTGSEALSVVATSELFVAGPAAPLVEEPEIDLSSFYTMSEVDALIASAVPADVITESELTTALGAYATTATLTPIEARLTAVEQSGGSEPKRVYGPFRCEEMAEAQLLKLLTPTDLEIPAGHTATVGLRVIGYTGAGAAASIVRDCRVTLSNVSGVLSTPEFAVGVDITQGLEEAATASGWGTTVRIATGAGALEVLGLSGAAESHWRVALWTSAAIPLASASETAELEEVVVTVPAVAGSYVVPLRWAYTPGVNEFLAWEAPTATLPGTPAWVQLPPATITVASEGTHHLHFAGRAGGVVTAIQSVDVLATTDVDPPTITAFTVAATSASLDVAVTALTASESGCYVRLYQGATPTGTWVAIGNVTTFHCAAEGANTINCQVRDAVGNVQTTVYTANTTITLPDTTAPTLTTCTLAATPTSLVVPLTLVASESGCQVQLYQGATPSGSWIPIASATSFTFPADGEQTLNVRVRDAAGNVQATVYTASTTIVISDNTLFFEDEFTGEAGPAPGWVAGTQYTGQAQLNGSGRAVFGSGVWSFGIIRNACGGNIPADDYCVTFAAPRATFAENDLGLAVCVTESGGSISGLHVWLPSSSALPTLRSGQPLTNSSAEMTTTVTGTIPASWASAAQLLVTLRVHTVGGTRRLTLYLNGHEYSYATEAGGYLEGAGAVAGTGIAIDGLQAQSKTFDYVRVTLNPPEAF